MVAWLAALGVFLKTKNQKMKAVAASASITALFGITEPAIYGATLRLKRPMVCAVICGAIGGGVMGWGGSYGTAFANQGILTIPVYSEAGTLPFMCYLIGIAIAFFGSAALTYVVGFEDIPEEEEAGENPVGSVPMPAAAALPLRGDLQIDAPAAGRVIALSEVADPVFSSAAMGQGVGIEVSQGEIIAPADCTVSVLYPTLHAIGLKLDNGAELLIHIGIDTVKLKGEGFEKFVEAGSHITRGTKIVSFAAEKIQAAGYDPTVIVVVTNSDAYQTVAGVSGRTVKVLDEIIRIVR